MKYNYDKKVLKGLSVSPFLNLTKTRDAEIAKGDTSIPSSIYNVNRLAAALHPSVQYGVITEVSGTEMAKTYTIEADKEKGTDKLAFFRAGQYVSVTLSIGESVVSRPYTIGSSPTLALADPSRYSLTVKGSPNGFAANYILENWKIGTKVEMSGPQGEFYYTILRDAPSVIALAGGSGITPFVSMAEAIAAGNEDFALTILYGCRTEEQILLRDRLEKAANESGGRVQVVYVLSDEEKEGYEKGFLSADLITRYAPKGDYSVFACGPKAMYRYAEGEIAKLGLPRRRFREELSGEYGTPFQNKDYTGPKEQKEYSLTVIIRNKEQKISCRSDETLLEAMERAGIHAPNHCRSGECGWCHSLLKEGQIFIPHEVDGRRMADVKFGWIHPCVSFPLSDIVLEVPMA